MTVGRKASCEINIAEACAYVSGEHCRIHIDLEGEVRLEDLSANGTFIDGVKVGRGNYAGLRHGSEVSLAKPTRKGGALKFKLLEGSSPAPQARAAPAPAPVSAPSREEPVAAAAAPAAVAPVAAAATVSGPPTPAPAPGYVAAGFVATSALAPGFAVPGAAAPSAAVASAATVLAASTLHAAAAVAPSAAAHSAVAPLGVAPPAAVVAPSAAAPAVVSSGWGPVAATPRGLTAVPAAVPAAAPVAAPAAVPAAIPVAVTAAVPTAVPREAVTAPSAGLTASERHPAAPAPLGRALNAGGYVGSTLAGEGALASALLRTQRREREEAERLRGRCEEEGARVQGLATRLRSLRSESLGHQAAPSDQADIASVADANRRMEGECAELRARLGSLREENARKTFACPALEEEAQKERMHCAQLHAELDDERTCAERAEAEAKVLRSEAEAATDQAICIREELARATARNACLAEECAEASADAERARSSAAAARRSIEGRSAALTVLRGAVREHARRVSERLVQLEGSLQEVLTPPGGGSSQSCGGCSNSPGAAAGAAAGGAGRAKADAGGGGAEEDAGGESPSSTQSAKAARRSLAGDCRVPNGGDAAVAPALHEDNGADAEDPMMVYPEGVQERPALGVPLGGPLGLPLGEVRSSRPTRSLAREAERPSRPSRPSAKRRRRLCDGVEEIEDAESAEDGEDLVGDRQPVSSSPAAAPGTRSVGAGFLAAAAGKLERPSVAAGLGPGEGQGAAEGVCWSALSAHDEDVGA